MGSQRHIRHRWHPRAQPPVGLVTPVRVDPTGAGGPTKAQAAGPRWRRTSAGFYVPADVSDDLPEQRILEQSMRLPSGGAVTGWAACRLLGANLLDGLATDGRTRLPVPLWVGDRVQLTEDEHFTTHRGRLHSDETTVRHAISCARALRAVFDTARFAPTLREAVVAIDMMAAAELVSLQQISDYLVTQAGARGVRQVRSALGLADEGSRSPNETRLRLIWVLDAGAPPPLVNQPVFDLHGRLLGVADLLDPVAGLVGEYDGADHRSARRHSADVAREARLRNAGLEVVRVTGPDLGEPALVVERILDARRRARSAAPGRRAWTIEAPEDWPLELSLHDRLEQRAEWERWEHESAPSVS